MKKFMPYKIVMTAGVFYLMTAFISVFAACPAITVDNMEGVPPGEFPQQYELKDFEKKAKCKLSFKQNPAIKSLNSKIQGNKPLPALKQRLPQEPLVVVPYDKIGKYGGTLKALSNGTEAGTSDFLSIRHVNLVRYSDDLKTIVPDVAKGWKWNKDYTSLTFYLRKGHKWSDGQPFTAEDIKFWHDNLALDKKIIEKTKDYVLVAGKKMTVKVIDPQTVQFNLPSPKPGLLAHFAISFAQGFQPKHFLGKFHPDINKDADKYAKKLGFKNGLDAIKAYFGNSDWTDTASPLLNSPKIVKNLPAGVVPTLESHITVSETTEGRRLVANPYFFMVDTAGNQLPYINEQDELFINDNEVRILKLINGEVDYKAQSLQLASAPVLLDNQKKGKYKVDLRPKVALHCVSFNVTSADLEKRKIFGNVKFRKAMSIAINRGEINDVAFFGQGEPRQYIGFSPAPEYVNKKWLTYATEFDPDAAKKLLDEIGLVDKDGDGFRDLPSGKKLVLNLQFSVQGIAGQVVELVAQHWSDVGVKSTVKEVTPDEYRSAQSSNKLDIGLWEKGQPQSIIQSNNELWVPPFENYFGHRVGLLWSEYIDSKGANGVKPPAFVMKLIKDINAFQTAVSGSAESKKLGADLAENMAENLLFIGIVQSPDPIYHRNALQNFTMFKTASYEYYRTFPYRAKQWFFD